VLDVIVTASMRLWAKAWSIPVASACGFAAAVARDVVDLCAAGAKRVAQQFAAVVAAKDHNPFAMNVGELR
jgi:hypothetical protein